MILMSDNSIVEYPQISFFDKSGEFVYLQTDDFLPSVTYNKLDASGKIFPKVDWVTMIFTDCSMNDVLKHIKLKDSVSEFCKNMYEISRGYSDVVKFFFNGVSLETNKFSFYGDSPEEVFDVVVPKVRLELTGSGLDYLRSIGIDFNSYRFSVPDLPTGSTFHFSRIDFAYDFIDYQPGFLDALITHCNTHQLPSGRVPLASTHGAIKCKIVTGDRKVCYLGSEQSDRFLRVYDKRLQMINRSSGAYVKANPYGNPESWIRLEWQLRNIKAHDLALDQSHDFLSILKLIFDAYSMADGLVKRDRAVVDFWLKLFPWREVESRIIQKANFVIVDTPESKLCKYMAMIRRQVMFYYTLVGRERFAQELNDFLNEMFFGHTDLSERRAAAFRCKLNEMSSLLDIIRQGSPGGGLYYRDNKWGFEL